MLAFKTWVDFLEGLRSYGCFNLRESKFSAPPSNETIRQTPNVFQVQQRVRGGLSPRPLWMGLDFTHCRAANRRPAAGAAKTFSFCAFVRLRIQTLPEQGLGYRAIATKYPEKNWKLD